MAMVDGSTRHTMSDKYAPQAQRIASLYKKSFNMQRHILEGATKEGGISIQRIKTFNQQIYRQSLYEKDILNVQQQITREIKKQGLEKARLLKLSRSSGIDQDIATGDVDIAVQQLKKDRAQMNVMGMVNRREARRVIKEKEDTPKKKFSMMSLLGGAGAAIGGFLVNQAKQAIKTTIQMAAQEAPLQMKGADTTGIMRKGWGRKTLMSESMGMTQGYMQSGGVLTAERADAMMAAAKGFGMGSEDFGSRIGKMAGYMAPKDRESNRLPEMFAQAVAKGVGRTDLPMFMSNLNGIMSQMNNVLPNIDQSTQASLAAFQQVLLDKNFSMQAVSNIMTTLYGSMKDQKGTLGALTMLRGTGFAKGKEGMLQAIKEIRGKTPKEDKEKLDKLEAWEKRIKTGDLLERKQVSGEMARGIFPDILSRTLKGNIAGLSRSAKVEMLEQNTQLKSEQINPLLDMIEKGTLTDKKFKDIVDSNAGSEKIEEFFSEYNKTLDAAAKSIIVLKEKTQLLAGKTSLGLLQSTIITVTDKLGGFGSTLERIGDKLGYQFKVRTGKSKEEKEKVDGALKGSSGLANANELTGKFTNNGEVIKQTFSEKFRKLQEENSKYKSGPIMLPNQVVINNVYSFLGEVTKDAYNELKEDTAKMKATIQNDSGKGFTSLLNSMGIAYR